jgi:hypothetical protein
VEALGWVVWVGRGFSIYIYEYGYMARWSFVVYLWHIQSIFIPWIMSCYFSVLSFSQKVLVLNPRRLPFSSSPARRRCY